MEQNMKLYEAVRTVPENAKKTISAGRLKGMTDINPMWRIKSLTEQFGACGVGWYIEPLFHWEEEVDDEVCVFVELNLYVKYGDEWSKPIYGVGGSKLASKEKKGLYVNDECYKMATTDAISVACKSLGMGADVYWQNDNTKYNDVKKEADDLVTSPITKSHIEIIELKAKDFNVNIEDITKRYGKEKLEDLTEADYGRAMNTFQSMARARS